MIKQKNLRKSHSFLRLQTLLLHHLHLAYCSGALIPPLSGISFAVEMHEWEQAVVAIPRRVITDRMIAKPPKRNLSINSRRIEPPSQR